MSRLGPGCGPNSWRRHVPTWHFKELCIVHDYAYAHGGTEKDREDADYVFYDGMRRQTAKEAWWRRPWMYYEAWVFYVWVRKYGSRYFHYHAN